MTEPPQGSLTSPMKCCSLCRPPPSPVTQCNCIWPTKASPGVTFLRMHRGWRHLRASGWHGQELPPEVTRSRAASGSHSVKSCLRKSLGQELPPEVTRSSTHPHETTGNLLTEIEAIINTRLLVYLGADDLLSLSPADLLQQHTSLGLPDAQTLSTTWSTRHLALVLTQQPPSSMIGGKDRLSYPSFGRYGKPIISPNSRSHPNWQRRPDWRLDFSWLLATRSHHSPPPQP